MTGRIGVGMMVGVALVIGATTVGCTDTELTEGDGSTATTVSTVPPSTTTTLPSGTTAVSTAPAPGAPTTVPSGSPDVIGTATLTIDDGFDRPIEIAECTTDDAGLVDLVGNDASGNTLQVKASLSGGGWTLEGGDQTREGSVDEFEIDDGGAFTASGRAAPIGGASAPASWTMEGECSWSA